MRRRYRDYTAEFRARAVRLALESGQTTKVAHQLGIPKATLCQWVTDTQREKSTQDPQRDTSAAVTDQAPGAQFPLAALSGTGRGSAGSGGVPAVATAATAELVGAQPAQISCRLR